MAKTEQKHAKQDETLPTSPEQLFSYLDELKISYELYNHNAVFTVEESRHLNAGIPGIHCRNLFLRDKKKVMYLVVARNETKIDLKKLEKLLESGRLSFASADRLWRYLGVKAGSVCPYAVINDKGCDINIVLDQSMRAAEPVNYHPLVNSMTISVAFDDLLKFIDSCGHNPLILDFGPAAPDKEQHEENV